jgi:hypothetical protein
MARATPVTTMAGARKCPPGASTGAEEALAVRAQVGDRLVVDGTDGALWETGEAFCARYRRS